VDTVHECDRQTDGQTDRITITNTVQRIASHGKNRDSGLSYTTVDAMLEIGRTSMTVE